VFGKRKRKTPGVREQGFFYREEGRLGRKGKQIRARKIRNPAEKSFHREGGRGRSPNGERKKLSSAILARTGGSSCKERTRGPYEEKKRKKASDEKAGEKGTKLQQEETSSQGREKWLEFVREL